MNDRCELCGAEVVDAQPLCDACSRDEDAVRHPVPPASGPGDLSQWNTLGWKPGPVMDAVRPLDDPDAELPSESMPERSAAERASRAPPRRTAVIYFFIVALALLVVLYVETRDGVPNDRPEADWPALDWPAALAAQREAVPDSIPDWAPDRAAALRALESLAPVDVDAARASYVPLSADIAVAHDAARHLIDVLCDADATWQIYCGTHPHPVRLRPVTMRERAAMCLALMDTRAWCDAHPADAAADLHERHDRALLAEATDRWLEGFSGDDATLQQVADLTSWIWHLAVVRCCPVEDRRAAVTGCLRDVPRYVEVALGQLRRPQMDRCLSTAATLEYEAVRIHRIADAWAAEDPAQTTAIKAAAVAFLEAAKRLRSWPTAVTTRDTDERTRAATAYFADLCREAGGQHTPRELFDLAVLEMRMALRTEVDTWEEGYTAPRDAGRIWTPTERIRRLRAAAPRWVGELPDDPGVEFRSISGGGSEWQGLLHAPGPRAPAVATTFLSTWPDLSLRAEDAEHEKRVRQHLAAHETYPGHHLQWLFARETCELRTTLGTPFVIEGWAQYAEDLIHETGQCRNDTMDRYVRADDRLNQALGAALEMLYATGRHSVRDLATILGRGEDEEFVTWIGGAVQPGTRTPYVFGRMEIERLREEAQEREGESFDLQRFHRRLLSAGAIPSRLLAEELRAE